MSETRYRCTSCGNLTRFDVVRTTRSRSFHHYTTGGDLSVDDTEVLSDTIESVTCRWCGPTGSIEEMTVGDDTAAAHDGPPAEV